MPVDPCRKCGKPHERNGRQACTGHRNDGGPCRRWPSAGAPVCRQCGGGAPQVKAAAARRVAEAKAAALAQTLGTPVDTDPQEAILSAIRWSAGHVEFYRAQVQALAPDSLVWGRTKTSVGRGPQGPVDVTDEAASVNAWLDLYDKERDRLAKLCIEAIKIGLDERRVRLAEQQATMLSAALRDMVAEARLRLDLNEAEGAALMDLVGEMLQRLERIDSGSKVS